MVEQPSEAGGGGRDAVRRRVRPYLLTGGRTRPAGRALPIETIVVAQSGPAPTDPGVPTEGRRIAALCQAAMSIAEVAGRLHLPLGVVQVLVGDLAAAGAVTVAPPVPRSDAEDIAFLERLLDGIRAL